MLIERIYTSSLIDPYLPVRILPRPNMNHMMPEFDDLRQIVVLRVALDVA